VILFHDSFILLQRYAEHVHNVVITVPMLEPVPPNCYISIISDRWLHAETRLPISFTSYFARKVSSSYSAPRPTVSTSLHLAQQGIQSNLLLDDPDLRQDTNPGFPGSLYDRRNAFIGVPTGSGKTICAEFALIHLWSKGEQPRAVCIEPYQEMVDQRVMEWRGKFEKLQGGKEIVSLTGETSADLRLLEKGDPLLLKGCILMLFLVPVPSIWIYIFSPSPSPISLFLETRHRCCSLQAPR